MKKIGLSIVVLLILGSGFVIGYRHINRQFPATQEVEGNIHETQQYAEGVDICIEEARWASAEEIEEAYKAIGGGPPFETELIYVNATLTNQAATAQEVNVSQCNVETLGWSNGLMLPIYFEANAGLQGVNVSLEEGESKHVVLPFMILENGFQNAEWEDIRARSFFLTYTLYPTKHTIQLFGES